MDNLTHSLVGAAVSKAGAERVTPLATATLVVAANAPDIDMLSFVRGEYFALAFRRGITHGWPAMFVLPFLVTAVMLAWDRGVRGRRDPKAEPARATGLLALSVVGLLTHPFLDWMNIYGMRWWMPFDGTWTYGDSLFIIDPWIWLALGGVVFLASAPRRRGLVGWGVLAAATTALVTFGMGGWPAVVWGVGVVSVVAFRLGRGEGGGRRRTRAVRVVVAASVAYVAAMTLADRATRADVLAAATEAGLAAQDVLVAPSRGVPFRTELEVVTPHAYLPGSHDWLRSPRAVFRREAAVPKRLVPSDEDPAAVDRVVEAARARTRVANYLVWARYSYVHVARAADGWRVRFGDARYDSTREAGGLAGLTVHVSDTEIR